MMRMYRYSGAGNDFIMIDGRNADVSRFRRKDVIHPLCLMYGTDGLIILGKSQTCDFSMEFYNPDGSCGMMCGNGGRCAVAFADLLGVKPFHTSEYVFEAPDGVHRAYILSQLGENKTVRLEMGDVTEIMETEEGYFLDTGTRHLVVFVPDAELVDVNTEGARLRNDARFAPLGTNVDFVSIDPDGALRVRTFEKGVERETLACGTGITASAIAACYKGMAGGNGPGEAEYTVRARQDILYVGFHYDRGVFSHISLTGPALCEGDLFE